MNSNQQISDYIFFYPDVMDTKTCEWIINRYDTTAKWQQSTFSTAYKNTGTSRVAMDEYWIKSEAPYYKDLKKSFEYCVHDYISVYDKIKSTEYTDFRINRYGEGGFMKQHIDGIHVML